MSGPVQGWSARYDGEEPQRVNRWLAQAGVCSRREAEALIAEGRVRIDGERVDDPGRKIAPGETLALEALAGDVSDDAPTVVMNKPPGFVSAQPEAGQTPAARLLTAGNLWGDAAARVSPKASLAPLGRLDLPSRGLLLLSQDGVLAKALIGPASQLDKEYLVRVRGQIDARRIGLLRHGLSLDGRLLKPVGVEQTGPQTLRFTLHEGRNRQIRRMCELVGLGVADLFRVRIGPLSLRELPEGRWRPLAAEEREALLRAGSASL